MARQLYTHKDSSTVPASRGLPLSDKRIILQPSMSVRGWITNAGSKALEGYEAIEDATAVTRLRDAGAALVGTALMSELGFGLRGDTSAEIISTGQAHVGLITDAMGEARIAAAGSGLFGFKPTFGIVSRFGLIGLMPSMECCGVTARTVEDIIAVLAAIAGADENDFSMADRPFPEFGKIREEVEVPATAAVIRECYASLGEKEQAAFKAGLAKLEKAGLSIQELSFQDFDLFRTVHNVIGAVEASSSAGKYDGVRFGHRAASGKNWNDMYLDTRGESFGTLIKTYLLQGAYFQFENYSAFEDACRIRGHLVRRMAGLMEKADVVVLPTLKLAGSPTQALTVNETYEAFSLTLPANVTGQPSLHVPLAAVESGVDVGLQILGSMKSDARLLALGMKLSSTSKGVHD